MQNTQEKKRNQDLGIFYTPQEVVNFVFQILKIWKDKEDQETKRWQSRKPWPHYPSVIDPACGEGVFLKSAITTGFTGEDPRFKAPYVWGIDLDNSVVDRWEQISLLSLFHGDKVKMNNHFYHQNGLLPLEEKHLMYKNADEGLHSYDAVVGNPPYGGVGLESISPELEKALFEYSVWKRSIRRNTTPDSDQLGLLSLQIIDSKEKDRIIKFPIEILFLERFIQLAKPGGWIAIIIPDGILTNSNSHYVREFLSDRVKVEAIISLPRETFKNVGTNAKTSILFLRKLKERENSKESYKVFLGLVEKINQNNFDTIVKSYERVYNLGDIHMNKSNSVQITKDQTGKEVVMVRIDKNLKQLMEELPQSRFDVKYWHPKYDYISQLSFKTYQLRDFLIKNAVISADTVRASRGESYSSKNDSNHPYRYYSVEGIWSTGYNLDHKEYGSQNAYNRLKRSELKEFDIAIARSGTGSLGKSFIFVGMESPNIVSDLYIVRCDRKLINPFYVLILLKTKLGEDQIQRNEKGVSGQTKLTADMIEYFVVPEISNTVQEQIEANYRKILNTHIKALEAKNKEDNSDFKKYIGLAEKMLRELITKTEEVIRGERSDIL